MPKNRSSFGVLATLVSFLLSFSTHAATKYISDEFEVTLRSGTSTANSIVRMLKSGEAVNVLEQDLASQYSLVETSDNKKGYILSRFLDEQLPARDRLVALQEKFEQQSVLQTQQKNDLDQHKIELKQAKEDNSALKNALLSSEQEVAKIRNAAENTLAILQQNEMYEGKLSQLAAEKTELSAENIELKDSTKMDWFIRGGAVSLIAFLIGVLITRIRWSKKDSWAS